MHRVYMRFQKDSAIAWRVSFVAMEGDRPMREFTFTAFDKIEQMAERAGALRDLACKQGLDNARLNGVGGIMLNLSDDQFQRVSR